MFCLETVKMEKYFHTVWAEIITILEVGSQKDGHLHERINQWGRDSHTTRLCLGLDVGASCSSFFMALEFLRPLKTECPGEAGSVLITEGSQFELKCNCIEECPSSLLIYFRPSRFWNSLQRSGWIFFLTCKLMFIQVKCIERRQSFSLGMRDLKQKKIPSIFAYKDWSSCCPLRKYWKNLSMTY